MTLRERIEAALDGLSVEKASATGHGYHVETQRDGAVLIRWGHGEPFVARQILPEGLPQCRDALRAAGLEPAPGRDGLSLLVRD